MKIKSAFLQHFHLDKTYYLLSGRCTALISEYFKTLSIHDNCGLNDIQLCSLLSVITDLTRKEIYLLFELFDLNSSGYIDFNEFYILICLLIATKDDQVRGFIHRHSKTVFDLLDANGSDAVSAAEFKKYGFLFGFHSLAVNGIFREFDVTGDKLLDYREFRMFALACLDKQQEMARLKELKITKKREKSLQL